MRPILATISRKAFQHNLAVVKKHAPNSKIMAVVKANAYGHGLFTAAQALNGADGFAVLGLNEAIDLREAGYEQRIVLLEGVFDVAELNIATSYHIDIVLHHLEQVLMLEKLNLIAPIDVYLKLNTGMNRLGFTPDSFKAIYTRLVNCKNVNQITLMTHFATADMPQGVDEALLIFNNATQNLSNEKTLANSAAILLHPQTHADWVRPGIMLYGATPVTHTLASDFNLKPVMTLTSKIISTQTLEKGASLGYGNRFTATKKTKVGVVACGYADGYPRHAGQQHENNQLVDVPIAVNGHLTRILGRVSMDMLFCDLTEIPHAEIGADVELWGSVVPVDSVAEACGTVGYELLCAVAPRVLMKVVD